MQLGMLWPIILTGLCSPLRVSWYYYITDHYPVFHINKQITTMVSEIYIEMRFYNHRNKQAFLGDIQEIDWGEIYSTPETQSCFDMFHGKLVTLLNKCFPKIRMKMKYNDRKPWLSDALQNSIKLKNKLYYKFRKVNSVYNETFYKAYKQVGEGGAKRPCGVKGPPLK